MKAKPSRSHCVFKLPNRKKIKKKKVTTSLQAGSKVSLRYSSSWQGCNLVLDDIGPPKLLLGDSLPWTGGLHPIVSSNATFVRNWNIKIVYVYIDIYFKANDRLYPVC